MDGDSNAVASEGLLDAGRRKPTRIKSVTFRVPSASTFGPVVLPCSVVCSYSGKCV